MLTLERKEGESLILITSAGQMIRVVLTRASTYKAKISIEAPDDVQIIREELIEVVVEQPVT
ncbi:MAG: hypothetical protein OI74_04095 [Gammaproteobacteria bacterium (ex Lamellibrachia satsuma)]|nr:MAG: carbon storage regulator [Gammaproteobacteria bacterium (ex Lamellibrachia satsuma)]RRS34793.1 MAG: hypothetical protein NV67_12250 [Gammaproteobacteria bacterium (ex Lamellibrachia satsuma)]RRS34874.1 MAG: hypothetical protein OI74_04095 [Gammaproteobacteria bacterium (ex Lamellibrachia satsuma)]